ncbi:unnamed protein product [Ectocarpus sp. 12 AP-2014]
MSLRGASSGPQDLTSPEYLLNISPNRINSGIHVPSTGGVNRGCDDWRCTANHFLTREGPIHQAAYCSGRRRRSRYSLSRLPYFETRFTEYMRIHLHILRSISPFIDGGCRNYIYIKQGKISPTKEPASYASASHGDRDTTIRGGGKQTSTKQHERRKPADDHTHTLSTKPVTRNGHQQHIRARNTHAHPALALGVRALATPGATTTTADRHIKHRRQEETGEKAHFETKAHTSNNARPVGWSVGWLVGSPNTVFSSHLLLPALLSVASFRGRRSLASSHRHHATRAAAAAAAAGRVRPRPPEPSATTPPSCANATPPVAAPESTSRTTWSTRDSRLEEPPLSPALAGRCCSCGLWPWPCDPAGGGRSASEAPSGGQAASPSAATTAASP